MKYSFLNSKLRLNAGCRIELSGEGNYPGVISLSGNCPRVIDWGGNYLRWGFSSGQLPRK